jgi:hypothetical protein
MPTPALAMPALHTPPATPYESQTSGTQYQPLTMTHADIAATMAMAASRIRACISQYQIEADNTNVPSARIRHYKAGLLWEINVRA